MSPRSLLAILAVVTATAAAVASAGDAPPSRVTVEGRLYKVFYGDGIHNMGWNEVEVFLPARGFSFAAVATGDLRVFRPASNRYQIGGRPPRQEPWLVGEVLIRKQDADDMEQLLASQDRLRAIAQPYAVLDESLRAVATWKGANKGAGQWVTYLLDNRGIHNTSSETAGVATCSVYRADLVEARATLARGAREQLANGNRAENFEFQITSGDDR